MKNELISIIAPVYNVEKYLKQFIESIINQTYKNFELLLVTDCPTDNSELICKAYAEKDDRVHVIPNEVNMGVAKTRNNGLAVAKGNYIMLADSDDYLSEDALEKAYQLLKKDKTDIVYCGFYTDCEGDIQRKKFRFYKRKYDYEKAIKSHLSFHTLYGYPWGKLYRKEVLVNVKDPEDMSVGEDGVFSYRALYNAKNGVSFTDYPIYYYRIRKDSLSGHGQQFAKRDLDIIKQVSYIRECTINKTFNKSLDIFEFVIFTGALSKYYTSDENTKANFENEAEYMIKRCKKCAPNCLIYSINPYFKFDALKWIIKKKY